MRAFAACTAFALVTALSGCGGAPGTVVEATGATLAATATPSTESAAIPPLSPKTLKRLKDEILHVRVVDAAEEHPRLSAAKMVARQRKAPIEMSLVRTTYEPHFLEDEMTAAELAAARSKAASEQNRLVWLMIFDDVTYPIHGPCCDRKGPSTYVSDMAAYVDANTGERFRSGNF